MISILPRKTVHLSILFVALVLPCTSQELPAHPTKRTHVELNGDYKVRSSKEALQIVIKEFDSQRPRPGATNSFEYFGMVSLPFEIKDFAAAKDSVFLIKLAHFNDNRIVGGDYQGTTSIAQAWVNPKNGKCLFFDAPWLMKEPKDVDGRFEEPLILRKLKEGKAEKP